MSRPKPKPRNEDEINNFINKGNHHSTQPVNEERQHSVIAETQKESTEEKRKVVKKSLTLDEEVDKGLRFIVAQEKKNHSKIIERLITTYLVEKDYHTKHDLKL